VMGAQPPEHTLDDLAPGQDFEGCNLTSCADPNRSIAQEHLTNAQSCHQGIMEQGSNGASGPLAATSSTYGRTPTTDSTEKPLLRPLTRIAQHVSHPTWPCEGVGRYRSYDVVPPPTVLASAVLIY
jgi:hypothetical protein